MDFNNIESVINHYGPKIIAAFLTLIVGWIIVKFIQGLINRALTKSVKEATLQRFLNNIVGVILKLVLFITVAGQLGIETTSFAAVIAAMGLAIGLALQGSLSNFAGGVLILLFKPFKSGDFISGGGVTGTVQEIQIFTTILKTPDNKVIICPNGGLSNSAITNFSKEPTRRVDMVVGIGYNSDLKKAKQIMLEMLQNDSRVLKDPAPAVVVVELADSSVNFAVRPWVNAADYWGLFNDFLEAVKLRFDEEGIEIPFPQTVVHLEQNN